MKKLVLVLAFLATLFVSVAPVMADGTDPMPLCRKCPPHVR